MNIPKKAAAAAIIALALSCGCVSTQERPQTQLSAWTMERLNAEKNRMETVEAELKPKKDAALKADAASSMAATDADSISQWAEADAYLNQIKLEISYRERRERVSGLLSNPEGSEHN